MKKTSYDKVEHHYANSVLEVILASTVVKNKFCIRASKIQSFL